MDSVGGALVYFNVLCGFRVLCRGGVGMVRGQRGYCQTMVGFA